MNVCEEIEADNGDGEAEVNDSERSKVVGEAEVSE